MHEIHMVACEGGGPSYEVLTINVHGDTTSSRAPASETLAPSPPVRSTCHVEPPEAILTRDPPMAKPVF